LLRRFSLWRRGGPPRQCGPVLNYGSLDARTIRRPLQSGLQHARLSYTWLRRAWRRQLSLAVLRVRCLRRTGTLRQAVLPLQSGLTRRIVAQVRIGIVAQIVPARIVSVRIGLPQRALLADDLAADALRGMNLAHDALVAQRLLRRDHQGRGGEAPTGAGPDRKAAGALGE